MRYRPGKRLCREHLPKGFGHRKPMRCIRVSEEMRTKQQITGGQGVLRVKAQHLPVGGHGVAYVSHCLSTVPTPKSVCASCGWICCAWR
jgi:hypothetical protein